MSLNRANIKPGTFILFPGTGKGAAKCTSQHNIEFLNESLPSLVTIKSVSESPAESSRRVPRWFYMAVCAFSLLKIS